MPPVLCLSPSLSRFRLWRNGLARRGALLAATPRWPDLDARPFVKGDKPNRAAYSREKTIP